MEMFALNSNTWNHLTVYQKSTQSSLKTRSTTYVRITYFMYMCKKDLALNN